MKKYLITIILSILLLSLFSCSNKTDKDIDNNNIENYLQQNKSNNSYEEIIPNTVQYENENNTNNQEKKENRKFETIVSCQDCFHNIGFAEKVCEQNGKYYFERYKNENDKYDTFDWYVYVFDERQRYKDIKENNEPLLTNEGTIDIKKGQYIYILCSYNPDTEVLSPQSNQSYIYYMK